MCGCKQGTENSKNMCGMSEEKGLLFFFSPLLLHRRKHHTNIKRSQKEKKKKYNRLYVFKNIPFINNSRTLRYYPLHNITFIEEEEK
jgi:hypothetical protein